MKSTAGTCAVLWEPSRKSKWILRWILDETFRGIFMEPSFQHSLNLHCNIHGTLMETFAQPWNLRANPRGTFMRTKVPWSQRFGLAQHCGEPSWDLHRDVDGTLIETFMERDGNPCGISIGIFMGASWKPSWNVHGDCHRIFIGTFTGPSCNLHGDLYITFTGTFVGRFHKKSNEGFDEGSAKVSMKVP